MTPTERARVALILEQHEALKTQVLENIARRETILKMYAVRTERR